MLTLLLALVCATLILAAEASNKNALVPRNVRIDGKHFVNAKTGRKVVLSGPNVVMKGPPYLPSVSGTSYCVDNTDGDCTATGTCTSCSTFNEVSILMSNPYKFYYRLSGRFSGPIRCDLHVP